MVNNFTITFEELPKANLIIDALYEGGINGNAGDDPISKLLSCGNQGGFRYKGSSQHPEKIQFCVLYSELSDPDWPDSLDPVSGIFIYFGDNKKPGHDIHATKRKGNEILRYTFDCLHLNERRNIPPFFIFTKASKGRDVHFRGLAVPGAKGIAQTEDLVAIWKTKENHRFSNYRATFTVLDIPIISRSWIEDILEGNKVSENAPAGWKEWVLYGKYVPLEAPRTSEYRTMQEQVPQTDLQTRIIQEIVNFFKNHNEKEYAFEKCAAEIVRIMDRNIVNCEVTRPWRDGGRDALGTYRIGNDQNAINVEFALEAKCKNINSGSGIKDTSRLISRLRHRQFGIFVTTSFVSTQAYQEIVEDQHPVLIISGIDIANILINSGMNTVNSVRNWLDMNFRK